MRPAYHDAFKHMILTDLLSKKTQLHNRRFVKTREQYEHLLPHFTLSTGIPKNLFQICLKGQGSTAEKVLSGLPAAFVDNIRGLQEKNQDFIYQLVSDREAEDFIRLNYGKTVFQYYQRIDSHYPAAKADLLRYLLLYARGGVYLDLKSTIVIPLSENLQKNDQFLVFYWDCLENGKHHLLIPEHITKGEMLQAFIISARGHLFLRSVILAIFEAMDTYNPYLTGVGWTGVVSTTGPALYTKTIYDILQSTPAKASYREGRPFSQFGYQVSFTGEYTPGLYQKALSLKDYRECSRPVIQSTSHFLQALNLDWCTAMHFYRKRVLHLD